jgi:DNA repair and recombination RAD54-like protein
MEEVMTNRDPAAGVKTTFVLNLLRLLQTGTSSGSEKMLIFSQNLGPLLLLQEMFLTEFGWRKETDFLQLDGQLRLTDRLSIIERFNNPMSGVRVLLASTKACGEGITLTGASRVVFMDVLWNPAVIRQAISRAFRLGQKKIVYVYRLVVSGTTDLSQSAVYFQVFFFWYFFFVFHAHFVRSTSAWVVRLDN